MIEVRIGVGDLVISLTGRDQGEYFLVTSVDKKFVYLVNGKARKVQNPKRKNHKHVKLIKSKVLEDLALRISNKELVGNERVYKSIRSIQKKV